MDQYIKGPTSAKCHGANKILAKALLSLREDEQETRDAVKNIIRKVVDDILKSNRNQFRHALTGRRNRFDAHWSQTAVILIGGTIKLPTKNYDKQNQRLVIKHSF